MERLLKTLKSLKLFLSLILLSSVFCLLSSGAWSADCSSSCSGIEECQQKIDECQKLLELSARATKPHEEKALELEKNIAALEGNIKTLTAQIEAKKAGIIKDKEKITSRQKVLQDHVREFYKKDSFGGSLSWLTLFEEKNINDVWRQMGYRQTFIDRERRTITGIALEVHSLNQAREKLEADQSWLAKKKKDLETVVAPIRDLVNRAKAYQGQLSQTVGVLSARQQQLLAEKTGSFITSVGEVPDTQDDNSSLDGFRRNAPAGSFAGFSFGAPHRKGLSQYGAYGRAKTGQNAEDILRAYYGGLELKKDYSTSINITVQGYDSYNLEDYVKRIYEVPNSWGDSGGFEALKAQAVAARSYALAYTNNGAGSICASESCQVFQPNPKGGHWERAVNDTRGWVLLASGRPFSAWYAASAGGYAYSYSAQGHTTPGLWDTTCGNQSCWTDSAYEKTAASPWFYKAWYKPRFRPASRPNAWLSKDEFVDITNAALLYIRDSGALSHLSQTDKSNPDTWSREEVRRRLGGEAITDVFNISATYSTGGYTSNVHLDTDRGGKDITGETFRQIFNLRAPGEIWLASSLFNVEKK